MADTRITRPVLIATALLGSLASAAYYIATDPGKGSSEELAPDGWPKSMSLDYPEHWFAYVDGQIDAKMKREGNTARVSPYGDVAGLKTYISINTPYRIACVVSYAWVEFGEGKDQIVVPVLLGDKTEASNNVNEALCRRISERVQKIMSAQK